LAEFTIPAQEFQNLLSFDDRGTGSVSFLIQGDPWIVSAFPFLLAMDCNPGFHRKRPRGPINIRFLSFIDPMLGIIEHRENHYNKKIVQNNQEGYE